MIIKIQGELDSVDRAELCARSIRDNIEGVKKINIHEKKRGVYENYYTVPAGFNFQAPTGFISGMYPNYFNIVQHNPQIEVGQEAGIEIECTEESARKIQSRLHSFGAMKIKKIY